MCIRFPLAYRPHTRITNEFKKPNIAPVEKKLPHFSKDLREEQVNFKVLWKQNRWHCLLSRSAKINVKR